MGIDIDQYTLDQDCSLSKDGKFGILRVLIRNREPVMAEKLGHTAHSMISAGKGKDEYGNDATTQEKGKVC